MWRHRACTCSQSAAFTVHSPTASRSDRVPESGAILKAPALQALKYSLLDPHLLIMAVAYQESPTDSSQQIFIPDPNSFFQLNNHSDRRYVSKVSGSLEESINTLRMMEDRFPHRDCGQGRLIYHWRRRRRCLSPNCQLLISQLYVPPSRFQTLFPHSSSMAKGPMVSQSHHPGSISLGTVSALIFSAATVIHETNVDSLYAHICTYSAISDATRPLYTFAQICSRSLST